MKFNKDSKTKSQTLSPGATPLHWLHCKMQPFFKIPNLNKNAHNLYKLESQKVSSY